MSKTGFVHPCGSGVVLSGEKTIVTRVHDNDRGNVVFSNQLFPGQKFKLEITEAEWETFSFGVTSLPPKSHDLGRFALEMSRSWVLNGWDKYKNGTLVSQHDSRLLVHSGDRVGIEWKPPLLSYYYNGMDVGSVFDTVYCQCIWAVIDMYGIKQLSCVDTYSSIECSASGLSEDIEALVLGDEAGYESLFQIELTQNHKAEMNALSTSRRILPSLPKTQHPWKRQTKENSDSTDSGAMFPLKPEPIQIRPAKSDEKKRRTKGQLSIAAPYEVPKINREFAIIVNMNNIFGQVEKRQGSEVDINSMTKLWKDLGFQVQSWTDLSASEFINKTRGLTKDASLRTHSCFVMVLMSHGSNGVISGADGSSINLREMFWMFSNEKCQNLAGKPKLFFIQSCREVDNSKYHVDSDKDPQSEISQLPQISDMVVAYSTISGGYSYRDTETGSVFIKAVKEVFEKHHENYDILKMLTEVIRTVDAIGYTSSQSPIFKSSLRRDLFL